MKKFTLLCVLTLLFVFAHSGVAHCASSIIKEIEMREASEKTQQPRSPIAVPKVVFYAEQSMLQVRFYSEQHYVLTVVDATSMVVFVTQLITDGGNHTYMLPPLQAGNYSLVLDCSSKTYEGWLAIL